jgi:hypothetical protein
MTGAGSGLTPNMPFTGGYSTQVPGTIESVIAQIENNPGLTGGIGNVSISATFATVPEPATVTLMATGLLTLLGVGYARRRQA